MKISKLALGLFLGFCSFTHADTVESPRPPITFAGGVDFKNNCSNIRDDRACDSVNWVSTRYGSIEKRNGSTRFISQAISTCPITTLYRAYTSSQNVAYRATIAATWDRILYSSSDISPVWTLVSSANASNQHYSIDMMAGKVLMAGDRLVDPIKSFDIVSGSMTTLFSPDVGSTSAVIVKAKYIKESRNYLIAGNVADVSLAASTTYYPNRIYFSLLSQPSSFTAQRWIEIRTDGLEEITGLFELNGAVEITFPNSIYELEFNVLNLTSLGGDQTLTPVVKGYGVIAPRAATSDGAYLFGLSKAGIFRWVGGRKTALTIKEEKDIISDQIEPIINRMIRAKTYYNAILKYYPKRQWLVFAYEDPIKFPHGVNNSCMVYDLIIGEWFPLANWNIDSMTTQDGFGDNGDLLYGDSTDGYVYYADKFGAANDARREMPIDSLDSVITPVGAWINTTLDSRNVKEGTGSIKLSNTGAVLNSSAARLGVFNFGEWQDKSKITRADKFSFKVFIASHVQNISTIRADLEIEDQSGNNFDINFTSIAITSATLTRGGTDWYAIEVPLSSFTILDNWTNLNTETFPLADALTFYGIRFVLTSIGPAEVYIDDLRLVGAQEQPLNASRLSKNYNLGSSAIKTYRQILLDAEIPSNSSLSIDIFKDFGKTANTINIPGPFARSLYVAGFNQGENLTQLDSVDFSYISSSQAASFQAFAFRSIVADENYIYAGDRYNQRLCKISKIDTDHFVSSIGSVGSGISQFNNAFQHAIDNKFVYIADMGNHRIKVHRKSDLSFAFSIGSLSRNATGFHLPTGVTVDEKFLFVGDDGNHRIKKLDKSTGGYITEVELNVNTFGNTTLANDEEFLYDAYNTVASTRVDNVDIVLEKRRKSDLTLVNKTLLRPQNNQVLISSYIIMGDLALQGDYLYVSFTDDENGNGRYYIQKLFKTDFSIVREYSSRASHYGLAADGLAYSPKRRLIQENLGNDDAVSIQYRFYESGLDNNLSLISHSFAVIEKPFQERK